MYKVQGKHEQVEPLLLQALDIGRKTLGRVHPWTIEAITGLIDFYEKLGEPDKADQYSVMLHQEESNPKKHINPRITSPTNLRLLDS